MFEYFENVAYFLLHGIIDYIIFLIVDFQFGEKIQNASSPQEKRNHWLVECCLLAILCLIIQSVSHWPLVIYVLLSVIVIYSIYSAPVTLLELMSFVDISFRASCYYIRKCFEYVAKQYRLWKRRRNGYHTSSTAANNTVRKRLVDYLHSRMEVTNVYTENESTSYFSTFFFYMERVLRWLYGQFSILFQYFFKNDRDDSLFRGSYSQQNGSVELTPLQPCGLACIEHGYGNASRTDNLCFFYSVLQCLFHSEGFVKLMLKKTLTSKSDPILQSFCILLKQVYSPELHRPVVNVCTLLHQLSQPGVMPELINYNQSSILSVQRQQDASEFFISFINYLHDASKVAIVNDTVLLPDHIKRRYIKITPKTLEELIQVNKKKMENCFNNDLDQMIESYSDLLLETAELRLYQYRKSEQCSHVRNLFELQYNTLVLCPLCKRVRIVSEPQLVLPVALPDSGRIDEEINLTVWIRNSYSQTEYFADLSCIYCKHELSEDNEFSPTVSSPVVSNYIVPSYSPGGILSPINRPSLYSFSDHALRKPSTSTPISHNPNKQKSTLPSTKKRFQKRVLFSHQPKILVLQLIRFRLDSATSLIHKNRYPVCVPAEEFSLAREITLDEERVVYRLSGLVIHLGDMIHGHYVSLCRHAATDRWYRIDDNKVTLLREGVIPELNSDMVKRNAYLLFYSRQN